MTKHKIDQNLLTNPTALSLAQRYEAELRKLIVAKGIISFRDYFIACYWDELPNEELTNDKIDTVINYLST